MIAAYDLAYQAFARSKNRSVPEFVVHDVVENVEGMDLKATLREANTQPSQYIVATLKEKLDSSEISERDQEMMTVLTLSQEDKLFERTGIPQIIV